MVALLLFLLLLPSEISRGAQEASERPYVVPNSIMGRVVSFGEPLLGVEVTLEQMGTGLKHSFTTGKDGMYHFDCLIEGNYSLTFKADHYITEHMESFNYRPAPSIRIDRQLQLDPSAGDIQSFDLAEKALIVFVESSTSADDLEAARITVSGANGTLEYSPMTNACGAGVILLQPEKKYSVRISKAGFKEKVVELDMPKRSKKIEVHLDPYN